MGNFTLKSMLQQFLTTQVLPRSNILSMNDFDTSTHFYYHDILAGLTELFLAYGKNICITNGIDEICINGIDLTERNSKNINQHYQLLLIMCFEMDWQLLDVWKHKRLGTMIWTCSSQTVLFLYSVQQGGSIMGQDFATIYVISTSRTLSPTGS